MKKVLFLVITFALLVGFGFASLEMAADPKPPQPGGSPELAADPKPPPPGGVIKA
jgi:hypothetical protein